MFGFFQQRSRSLRCPRLCNSEGTETADRDGLRRLLLPALRPTPDEARIRRARLGAEHTKLLAAAEARELCLDGELGASPSLLRVCAQPPARAHVATHPRAAAAQTLAVAKQAAESGLPEPPESFFETQERLIAFFREHGQLRVYKPGEVIIAPGVELHSLYAVEEGSVLAEKDVMVLRRTRRRASVDASAEGEEERPSLKAESMQEKAEELAQFKSKQKGASPRAPGADGDGGGVGPAATAAAAGSGGGGAAAEKKVAHAAEAAAAEGGAPAAAAAATTTEEGGPLVAEAAEEPTATATATPRDADARGGGAHRREDPRHESIVDAPIEKLALSTLEQDELLGEVPFIEGSAVEVRYVAEAEGCALRELPASRLIEELTADTTFAGNVFRNIAITLSVKCEQICWRLEDMAVEASSMGWRANWRMRGKGRREKAKYAVSRREGRRLQELLGVPLDEELHHSTTSAFDSSMRVHGHLLVFSESIAFHSKVFGMTVKKVLPVSSIVTVLRDTPATRDVNDAIEVACMEDTFIFSEIPDLTETCEAVHEVITLASRHKRGSVNQTLELNQDAREAARQALSTAVKPREADGFEQRFQLAADDWLDFLQREAHCCVYAKGEVIVSQNQESDALFQIARGCVRVEKTTHLGDGTVVISRLGPPAVFGEFFFLMGARTRSLTSFVSDADGTELYIIKPDSLQPYLETKPMMPVCLYKYLAASMARKYRVLSATAGFGLIRSGDGFFDVPFDEIFENPVFLSLYARFLRSELPAKMPWLQFWQDADEFRTMPRGTFANKQGRSIFAQYVRADARLRIQLPAAIVEPIDAELSTRKDGEGRVYCIRSETFDAAQLEVFEGLRTHTYNKFVGSGFFGGVQELKAREKEVPAFHHFYYLKRLGTGSFGEVFAVRKKDSHRKYAMKVMSKQAQSEMSRRWAMYLQACSRRARLLPRRARDVVRAHIAPPCPAQIECEVMAALSHPFLVNLNYAFQSAEVACMVLDLVSGGDMDAFQKRCHEG